MMNNVDNVDDFEKQCVNTLTLFKFEDNKWAQETYERHKMWTISYLKQYFFMGQSSNQRLEGMHSYQKRFLGSKLKLYEFVKQVDIALGMLREIELFNNFMSRYTSPQLITYLKTLEIHIPEMYTP